MWFENNLLRFLLRKMFSNEDAFIKCFSIFDGIEFLFVFLLNAVKFGWVNNFPFFDVRKNFNFLLFKISIVVILFLLRKK
jgi:hypothetical protein